MTKIQDELRIVIIGPWASICIGIINLNNHCKILCFPRVLLLDYTDKMHVYH